MTPLVVERFMLLLVSAERAKRLRGSDGRGTSQVTKSAGLWRLRGNYFQNSKDREICGIRCEQARNSIAVQNRSQLCVKDAFAAQVELPHPAQHLISACGVWFEQPDLRILEKFINPAQRLGHGKRRGESTRIRDYVQEFSNHQGWQNQLFPSLSFSADR